MGSGGRAAGVFDVHGGIDRAAQGGGGGASSDPGAGVGGGVWGGVANGLRLEVAPAGRLTLEEIGGTLKERGVSVLWLTAGLFHAMVEERRQDLGGVRELLAGGDVLSRRHVEEYLEGS